MLGDPNSNVYKIATLAAFIVLAIATAIAAIREPASNALIAGGFFVALAAVYWWAQSLPSAVLAFAAWAVAFNAAGWTWDWYKPVWGYDEFGHAIGTAGATLMVAFTAYRPLLQLFRKHLLAVSLSVLALGIALGTLWELIEWFGFYIFGGNPSQIFHDIISDLIFDIIGTVVAVPYAYWAFRDIK